MRLQRLGRSWIARLGFSAVLVGSVLSITAEPSSAGSFTFPLGVVADSFRFIGVPTTLPAEQYDVHFFNISQEDDHEFIALNLGPSCGSNITTVDDAKALLESVGQQAHAAGADNPLPFFLAACPGAGFEGAAFAGPNFGQDEETFTLTPGKTLYFCGVQEPDGTPHFELGMIGFIDVFSLPGGF